MGRLFNVPKSTFFGKKQIHKEIKSQVHQKVVTPSLMHGSKSWALSERNKSKVKAMEKNKRDQ